MTTRSGILAVATAAQLLTCLACQVVVPPASEVAYSCRSQDDCIEGTLCRRGYCVAPQQDAGVVADGGGRDAHRDAARDAVPPEAATDRAGFDRAAMDQQLLDRVASDQAASDREPVERPGDAFVADAAADAGRGDRAQVDAAPNDGAARDAGACQQGALHFDGDDFVERQHQGEYDGVTNITLEAWIKPDNVASEMHIVSHHNYESQVGYVLMLKGGVAEFRVYANNIEHRAPQSSGAGLPLSAGTWHHVAGVYDHSDLSVYVDGLLSSRTAASGLNLNNYSGPLRVGAAAYTNNFYFVGTMDDVRVTKAAVYTGNWFAAPGAPLGSSSDTVLLYHFDQTAPDLSATDSASHHYDGRLGANIGADGADPTWVGVSCIADRSLGAPACGTLFDSTDGYQYCTSTAAGCWFSVDYNSAATCQDICQDIGHSCLDSYDVDSMCRPQIGNRANCTETHNSQVCYCAP